MKKYFLLFVLFLGSLLLKAQDQLISVSTTSEKIILLHFDEGEKDLSEFQEYFIYDAPNANYYGQIDEAQSLMSSNFLISSPDDANYATPTNPVITYFKAKEQKGLFEYKVYIEVPFPLVQGATYSIDVSNINTNQNSYTFINNSFDLFSESIHVNQVGMIASAGKKYAYVSQWLGKSNSEISNAEDFSSMVGATCHIVRASDNEIIYTGTGNDGLQFRINDIPTGYNGGLANTFWTRSSVWQFDFSQVGTTIPTNDSEDYKVVIEGIGSSFPFKISNESYDDVVTLLAEGLYHQRSGIDRVPPYSNLPKPIDHMPGVDGFEITYSNYRRLDNVNADAESFVELPAQATDLINPTNPADWMTSPDDFPWGSGGHFDAGDHDIYTEHLMVPLFGTLSYIMAPQGFYDGQFNIPENSNTLPDILDEIRWTLDFFRRTKGPSGGICGGKETTGYYNPSWNNGTGESSTEQMWYVYREDPAASFLFAAASAQFALALQINGDTTQEAQIYIDEAIQAYTWATQNQEPGDQNLFIAGFPANGKFPDLQLMASSMLYSVTGESDYLDYYLANTSVNQANNDLYVFQEHDEQFATWAFTLIPQDKWDSFNSQAIALQNIQKQAVTAWAYEWGLDDQEGFPFRHISSQFNPPLGGKTASTPEVFSQLVAHYLSNDTEILNNVFMSNDLNLGGNQDNWVYITGADTIGAERYSSDPLHIDNWQYGGENIPGLPMYGLSSASFYYFQSSPPAEEWPHFECNSNARIYLGHSEFTVHQNSALTLAVYGYLNGVVNDNILNTASNEIETAKLNYTLAPNPASGFVTISSTKDFDQNTKVLVYGLNGQQLNLPVQSVLSQLIVDVSSLSSGIYIIKISEKDILESKKLIIQ